MEVWDAKQPLGTFEETRADSSLAITMETAPTGDDLLKRSGLGGW